MIKPGEWLQDSFCCCQSMFPDCVRCAAGSFTAEGLGAGAYQPSPADVHLAWSHRAHDQQLSGAFCKPGSRVIVFCRDAGFQDSVRSKLSDSRMFHSLHVPSQAYEGLHCLFLFSIQGCCSQVPYDTL